MAITYRIVKGTALTYTELDANFTTLVTSIGDTNALLFALDNEVGVLQTEVDAFELATASNLSAKQSVSEKGAPAGYAGLDGTGKVPSAQLPTNVAGLPPRVDSLETTVGLLTGQTAVFYGFYLSADGKTLFVDTNTGLNVKESDYLQWMISGVLSFSVTANNLVAST